MIHPRIIKKLSKIVGNKYLVSNKEELIEYASDGTKQEFFPDAVVFPGNPEEISKIFLLANMELFPVIPRGGGSGMSGGALPIGGGVGRGRKSILARSAAPPPTQSESDASGSFNSI